MDYSSYKPKGRIEHKHLIDLLDYSAADIYEILHLAQTLKMYFKRGKKHELLRRKNIAMIFSSPSVRARASFETGIRELGARPLFLSESDTYLPLGEAPKDIARSLSRYGIDGLVVRTQKQSIVEEIAENSNFSVVNGLTDSFRPCQALSDLFTITENFGKLNDIKLAYFGKSGNTANSLMLAGAKTGMNIYICSPKGYEPDPDIIAAAQKFGNVTVTDNVEEAATDADVIYTDTYRRTSATIDKKELEALAPYRVDSATVDMAKKTAVFMHCLPARRGEEVTETVIDSTHSVVFEQAENLLHTQKAILCLLIGKK